jgi:hypothetical protein
MPDRAGGFAAAAPYRARRCCAGYGRAASPQALWWRIASFVNHAGLALDPGPLLVLLRRALPSFAQRHLQSRQSTRSGLTKRLIYLLASAPPEYRPIHSKRRGTENGKAAPCLPESHFLQSITSQQVYLQIVQAQMRGIRLRWVDGAIGFYRALS